MENRTFSSIEEECHYYKELARLYRQEKADVQKEFEDFTEESRQLEQELEATLIQNEKQIRDAQQTIENLRDENSTLRQRLTTFEREAIAYETKMSKLHTECDTMKAYIRELEQKNDDLERTNRVVSESVAGFEAMLNQAYEKNAMLEMEIDEKEQLQVNLQRLMDEARDLKQELKIRNIAIPSREANKTSASGDVEPMDTSNAAPVSPSKNRQSTTARDVNRLNDINDSRNNNSLLDKTSSTTAAYNNSSLGDTTILNNMSFDSTTTSINNNESITKSHNNVDNFNKSSQSSSVLKYDCAINSNPIAASTRVSALNIVADLLKKLDNLEAKLKSWKTQKSPTQKILDVTASFNNNEKSISIENLDHK